MTRESDSGTRTPEGPDAFSPTTQLATFADDESRWNTAIRVADATARNALASPELRDGILVVQLDTHELYMRNGSDWDLVYEPDTGWTSLTLVNSWTVSGGLTPQYRRIGNRVTLRGRTTGGSSTTIATLPAGFRPATATRLPVSEAGTSGVSNMTINTDGTIVTTATSNSPYLDAVTFLVA